jgi:hypothetical protein
MKLRSNNNVSKWAGSRTESVKPGQHLPDTKKAEDRQQRLCNDIKKPGCKKSGTDEISSDLAKLLVGNERPRMVHSGTDTMSSEQGKPNKEDELPNLAILCDDVITSRCKKSSASKTDSVQTQLCRTRVRPDLQNSKRRTNRSSRVLPDIEKETPNLAGLCKEGKKLRRKESNARAAKPSHVELRSGDDEPELMKFTQDGTDPDRIVVSARNPGLVRPNACEGINRPGRRRSIASTVESRQAYL